MGESICQQLKRCPDCSKEYYTCKKHQCDTRLCPACKIEVGSDHQCFIKPFEPSKTASMEESDDRGNEEVEVEKKKKKKKRSEKPTTFIFYDLECRQDDVVGSNEHGDICRHDPNLAVVYKV